MPRKPPCLQFGWLPKATATLKSVNFKRTTPADTSNFANFYYPTKVLPQHILDPKHPAVKLDRKVLSKTLPLQRHEHISIRMVPHGLLNKPSTLLYDPPFSYDLENKPEKANMSLVQVVNVKGIHKSAVIRSTIRYRVKTAFAMITTRGADVVINKKGQEEIVFQQEDIGSHWVTPNWAYIASPTLELYRMPYTQMIPILRRMLQRLNSEAATLEHHWNHQRNQGAYQSKQGPSGANPSQRSYKDTQKLPHSATNNEATQESVRSASMTRIKTRSSSLPKVEVPRT